METINDIIKKKKERQIVKYLKKNKLLLIILIHIGVLLFFFAYYYFFDGCFIKKMFHVECPTCGVTRAWIYLFHGDINKAFNMHPLFIPLTLMFLILVHIVPITKRFPFLKIGIFIFTILTCILTLIRYVIYVI